MSSRAVVENYHIIAANLRHDQPWDYKLHEDPEFAEVCYEGDTWKLLADVPREPGPGEVVMLQIFHNKQVKRAVVKRDDDILTAEEIIKHIRPGGTEIEIAIHARKRRDESRSASGKRDKKKDKKRRKR